MSVTVGKGNVLSTVYEWEIANYPTRAQLERGEYIESPTFLAAYGVWSLQLYPNGQSEDDEGNISLLLRLKKTKPDHLKIQARYAFSIMNATNEVMGTYHSESMFIKNNGWGVVFLDIESENKKGKIVILCEIIIEKAKLYETILTSNSDRLEHFEGYKNLLKSPKFSDVKITVESKQIPAHKNILAANSPVFAAMFEHEMQENIQNNVIIEDYSYKIFCELLTFLYIGECTIAQDTAIELFQAANKYQVLKLKDMCEEELCKNISIENTIELLQLADMHSAEHLKKKAIEVVALQGKEIVKRPEFVSMRGLQPTLFREVFEKVFDRIV